MKLSEYPPKYLFQKKFETRDTQPYNREHEFVYKIDIYENWSENVSEKDIHNELEKQNIFDYENKDLMFYNRGISGNKIQDLNARWQQDTLDLNPDVLSILIGVNDVPKIIENEYSIKKWEETYIQVLDKTTKALPNTHIILCEPFILPSNDMARIDWTKERTESYQSVILEMQKIVKHLAEAYDAILIELQQPFLDACKKAPANYWIWDGIHPMPAGHELIARRWIKEVSKKLDFTGNN